MKTAYQTTFHHNGYVTFWNVYRQQWERRHATEIRAEILATLPRNERERICNLSRGQASA